METAQLVEKVLSNCGIARLNKNVLLWHRNIEIDGLATILVTYMGLRYTQHAVVYTMCICICVEIQLDRQLSEFGMSRCLNRDLFTVT